MNTPDRSEIKRIWGAEIEKISLHVCLRYVWEENGRWNLHVIIDELTTATELREVWNKIDQAQEKIKKYQGSDPKLFSITLLQQLKLAHTKASYQDLAFDLNFDGLTYLLCATDERRDDAYKRGGLTCFVNMLQTMGMNNEEIHVWEQNGRADIQNKRIPWGLSDGPIKRDRVIFILKQYKKWKANHTVVIKPEYDTKYLHRIWLWLIQGTYWSQAKELLEENKPQDYTKYSHRLNARELDLLTTMEFSVLNFP